MSAKEKIAEILGIEQKPTESRVSDALPYKDMMPDGTVYLKDNSLLKVWRVIYPDVSVAPEKADSVSEMLANFFRQMNETQQIIKTTFWFQSARLPIEIETDAMENGYEFMDPADKEIEKHRQEMLFGRDAVMKTVCYVGVRCSIFVSAETQQFTEESKRYCEELFAATETQLQNVGTTVRPLYIHAEDPLDDIFNFLKYNAGTGDYISYISPDPENVLCDISEILTSKEVVKGKPMVMGDEYVQVLTINSFPEETYPDLLWSLQTCSFNYRWTTRWIPLSNQKSKEVAKKLRVNYTANQKSLKSIYFEATTGLPSQMKDTQALVDTERIEDLEYDLADNEIIGYMTSTIVVSDPTLEGLNTKINILKKKLTEKGFDACIESKFQNFTAWKSSLVGDSDSGSKKYLMKAANIMHIIPFTDLYRGSEKNTTLGRLTGIDHPLMYGTTFTGELFCMNLNSPVEQQLGHFFVIGSTGAGKSVLLALMCSQFSRYPGSRVIFFDKDMSFKNLLQRDKGALYIPANEASPMHFAPLSGIITEDPITHTSRMDEAIEWLETVVSAADVKVTPEITADFREIARMWGKNEYPTVTAFTHRLKAKNPKSPAIPIFEKMIQNNDLATLFCGDKDEFTYESFARKTMIEMGPLMDLDGATGKLAVLPALQFMFSRMDELFDRDPKPTLLIMDEAWKFLAHPAFRQKIKEYLKTLRKKNVYVGFALQNINDIDDAEEFLTSCPTKIYLPNIELKAEGQVNLRKAYSDMGLSDSEISLIAKGMPRKDYIIKQPEGCVRTNFMIDKYQLERLARDGI